MDTKHTISATEACQRFDEVIEKKLLVEVIDIGHRQGIYH